MNNKRNLIVLAAVAVVIVVAVVVIAVTNTLGGSEQSTLESYYKALYTTEGGGIDPIVGALLPARQQEFYDSITVGGTNFSQLAMWQNEANSMVGGNVKVEVEVLRRGEDSAADLNAMRNTYGGDIEGYHTVAFQLTLTGDSGTQELVGVLPMARTGGKWYLLSMDAGLMRVVEDGTAQ